MGGQGPERPAPGDVGVKVILISDVLEEPLEYDSNGRSGTDASLWSYEIQSKVKSLVEAENLRQATPRHGIFHHGKT